VEDKLTSSQHRAIESADSELCVTAGAGSGKTRVLVERFTRLVLEERVPVEAILAITYTEKAAAEMKGRIAEAFEKVGKGEERRAVEFAYITTIDSFCARLLRENALEAEVDPRFTVLEEFEAGRLMKEIANEVLLAWPEERVSEMLEVTGIADLVETLVKLYEQIRHAGTPIGEKSLEPRSRPREALEEIRKRLADLREGMRQVGTDQADKVAIHLRLEEELNAIPRSDSAARQAAAVGMLKKRIHLGRLRNEAVNGPLRELKETLLDRFLGERLEEKVAPCRALLTEFLLAFDAEYEKAKRARSSLDFADLEWKVRRLLAGASVVRDQIRRRFRHIFLDEFQDTNPLQKEIVDLVRGGNRLFTTGDAKQSIYGFRDADVGIITEYQEQVEPSGGHILLPENFRSRPEIVTFTNRLFSSGLWIGNVVPFEPMKAAAAHDGKNFPCVEILRVEGENTEEARQNEARALANRVAELVESGALRFTRRDSGRRGKALSWGDVAILFRNRTSMRIHERELTERQIPYFVQKGKGYFQTQEVRDLMNLIRVLDNPRDDYHMAAVLRSPLCALSDDDLYRLSRAGAGVERGRFIENLDAAPGDFSEGSRWRLSRFRELLARLRSRQGEGPLWIALDSVLSETEIASEALLHFNGRRRFANLRKLVELVRVWESQGETSLPELVALLDDYRGTEVQESEAAVESPWDDTVKLMTIHAAKGLEFPLVALADLGAGETREKHQEIFRRNGGLGIPLHDPEGGTRALHSTSYARLKAERDDAQQQEEIRLLYVAVTRAQEHLILSGWRSESTKSSSSWLKSILEGLGGEAAVASDSSLLLLTPSSDRRPASRRTSLLQDRRDQIVRQRPLAVSPDILGAGPEADDILRRAELSAPAPETTPYLATATEIVQHHLCPRRYHLRYRIGAPAPELSRTGGLHEEDEPADVKDDEVPAKVLGDRVHRILAEIPTSPVVSALLATLSPEDQKDAARQVQTFHQSRLGCEAAEGQSLREFPFALARLGATLRGQIDLIIRRRDDSLLVVDYKTSRIEAERVEETTRDYELQLRIYALAIQEIFGRLPAGAFLYFLHPDLIREVDLSRALLLSAEEAIADFFAAHRSGAYPQHPARHCLSCGYRQAYCPNLRPTELIVKAV